MDRYTKYVLAAIGLVGIVLAAWGLVRRYRDLCTLDRPRAIFAWDGNTGGYARVPAEQIGVSSRSINEVLAATGNPKAEHLLQFDQDRIRKGDYAYRAEVVRSQSTAIVKLDLVRAAMAKGYLPIAIVDGVNSAQHWVPIGLGAFVTVTAMCLGVYLKDRRRAPSASPNEQVVNAPNVSDCRERRRQ